MSVSENYKVEGQLSIFDLYDPATWCGKMSPEPLAQTRVKTSASSSRKRRVSSIRTPLFLDLRGGSGGRPRVASWATGGALLGVYMTRSFGESPNAVKESRLSQILEENPHPRYCLSARACRGILRRSEARGKELPPLLKETLTRQAADSEEAEEMDLMIAENGIPKPLPFKSEPGNLGGVRESSYNTSEPGHYQPLTNNRYSLEYRGDATNESGGMCVLEGNGSRASHKGDGYKESETMYTLNTIENHAVCYSQDAYDKYSKSDKAATIKQSGGIYGGGSEALTIQ